MPTFAADVVQSPIIRVGVATISPASSGVSTIRSTSNALPGLFKVGDLVEYTNTSLTLTDVSLARVSNVGIDSIGITAVTNVPGIVFGDLPTVSLNVSDLKLVTTKLDPSSDSSLYTRLPRTDIESVDFTNASLTIRKVLSVDIASGQLSSNISAGPNETFLPFDEERYALIRSDGKKGIVRISIGGTGGVGYSTVPNVSISLPSLSPQLPASARAIVGAGGSISSILIQDAGAGFFSPPTITIGAPSSVGIGSGSYWFNELVTGSRSNATARVKNWDLDTKILQVGIETGTFLRGETITGSKSAASYTVQVSAANTDKDKYDHSDEIEDEADQILDFSEGNPFGLY